MNVNCTVPIRQLVSSSTPEAEAELEPDAPQYGTVYGHWNIERTNVIYGLRQLSASAWKRSTTDVEIMWIAQVQLHGPNRSSPHIGSAVLKEIR